METDPSLRVPTIDLSGDAAEVLAQVSHACEHVGFFLVLNHGVPDTLLRDTMVCDSPHCVISC
jgi:isopenicillin N synthase-like dioxygenase